MPRTSSVQRHDQPGEAVSSLNKHQQKTEATKRKLLKAARRIFARDGFEAARIDDIASQAGYTRGAFYAHFKTKEDLFFALFKDRSLGHRDQVTSLMESASNEGERLAALREYSASRAADREWSILVLEFKLYALRHPRLRARLAEAHRSIRAQMKLEALDRLLPAGLKTGVHSRELKKIAYEVMLNGLVLEHAYDAKSISEAQAGAVLRQFFDILVTTPDWGMAEQRPGRA